MGWLEDFVKTEMIFEVGPTNGKSAGAIVVRGVGCGVPVLVFDKVEVPPHDEEGGDGDGTFEYRELLSAHSKASRAKVDVETREAVGAILGLKDNAEGVAIETVGEGNNLVII
jgi:hypothetical protein